MGEYKVTEQKKEVFNCLYDLLVEFDRVCRENNLNYSLEGGTLIGAIRHDGFIPWDDDIDIMMPRKDYDKLKMLGQNGIFKNPYFFQTPDTDEGSPRLFIRLRNTETTSISLDDIALHMNHGIFIDIMPIDYVPNTHMVLKAELLLFKILQKISGGYAKYYSGVNVKGKGIGTKAFFYLLYPFYKSKIITSKRIFKLSEAIISNKLFAKSNTCGLVPWMIFDSKACWPIDYFQDGFTKHIFEDEQFSIVKNYDQVLTKIYGNYMKPKKMPTGHGNITQFANISYIKYIKENEDLLKEQWIDRHIVNH